MQQKISLLPEHIHRRNHQTRIQVLGAVTRRQRPAARVDAAGLAKAPFPQRGHICDAKAVKEPRLSWIIMFGGAVSYTDAVCPLLNVEPPTRRRQRIYTAVVTRTYQSPGYKGVEVMNADMLTDHVERHKGPKEGRAILPVSHFVKPLTAQTTQPRPTMLAVSLKPTRRLGICAGCTRFSDTL